MTLGLKARQVSQVMVHQGRLVQMTFLNSTRIIRLPRDTRRIFWAFNRWPMSWRILF